MTDAVAPLGRHRSLMGRVRRLLLTTVLLALALPASAFGHATMTNDAGRISWRSTDAASNSTLEVTIAGGKIRFFDPTEDGGMSPTRGCDPGQADQQGNIREVTCSTSGVTELFIDLGGGDDQARIDEIGRASCRERV